MNVCVPGKEYHACAMNPARVKEATTYQCLQELVFFEICKWSAIQHRNRILDCTSRDIWVDDTHIENAGHVVAEYLDSASEVGRLAQNEPVQPLLILHSIWNGLITHSEDYVRVHSP